MNHTFLIVISMISVAVIIVSVYFGTKQCCSVKRPEWYDLITPGDDADAASFRRDYLPDADTLSEEGGSLMEVAGLESPPLKPDQSPFIGSKGYLNYQ